MTDVAGNAVTDAATKARARLVVTADGPYRLEGDAELVDHLGAPIEHPTPALLCRCGRSQTKPFCDDSHLAAGFTGARELPGGICAQSLGAGIPAKRLASHARAPGAQAANVVMWSRASYWV